ncbi:MAG: orotidine 5'-phosphate decarboxylase [Firmicutes bacterium ADurb.Bin193]|nr:MAG: orotidine 5'-phosphate decarboxylase [Firmicutes bacterium ADurb.Bin193]
MSIDRLIEKIKEKNNPTVAGLDPKLEYVPKYITDEAFEKFGRNTKGAAEAIWQFNRRLIDSLCDIVPAVKPQSAYYEMYGWEGVCTLRKTIDYAQSKGLYVIADVKRNDIGTTAEAYARAYLGDISLGEGVTATAFNADAATVNGYLGSDGILPFLSFDKSIFVLVKTSNPSSGELQDLKLESGERIYEYMASLVKKWGEAHIGKHGYSNVGAVVGATYPEELTLLRKSMPKTYFLVPGYGAQGAKAADIAAAFNGDGLGAVINASRSIMCAYKKEGCAEEDFAKAARNEAIGMRDDIRGFM